MVALTVNEARKWRISSRANCLEPEPHQNIAVQAEDKGEADFRRERSDTRLRKWYLAGPLTSAAF